MPFCNKCGKQVGEGQVFCTGCGAKLPVVGPGAEPAAPVPAPAAAPAAVTPAPPKRHNRLAIVLVVALLLVVLAGAGGAGVWFLFGPGGSRTASESISAGDLESLGFDTVPGEQMGSGTGSRPSTTPADEPATP